RTDLVEALSQDGAGCRGAVKSQSSVFSPQSSCLAQRKSFSPRFRFDKYVQGPFTRSGNAAR
ncbi:MAG TPA: hypothetical protein VGF08_02415, partial [Terriglobales bacterium]